MNKISSLQKSTEYRDLESVVLGLSHESSDDFKFPLFSKLENKKNTSRINRSSFDHVIV